MEADYLIDRDTLGRFIDPLIAQKYPGQAPETLSLTRDAAIKSLDDRLGTAIFGSMTSEQGTEFDRLLDENPADESVYERFFADRKIDLPNIIQKTLLQFKTDFLGGTAYAN